MDTDRFVYGKNQEGYLVYLSLMIKIYPDVRQGVKVIGLFKKVEEQDDVGYILYDIEEGSIFGINKYTQEHLGIELDIINSDN
jgi:hypothetical protein